MSRAGANPDRTDAILERILLDLDRGSIPDQRVLREVFPGHEATIERLCALVAGYRATLEPADPRAGTRSRMEIAPGSLLGDFVVESLLAEGGMSIVYRARQRSLGMRVVALKVVPDEGDGKTRQRFQREALLAASVHHPHLAEVHGFGTNGPALFYAMELVEGPTLREVLEHRARDAQPLDAVALQAIIARVIEVASALAVLHRAGLVHRDVKPGNIVLAPVDAGPATLERSRAVLVDFGLARLVESETRTRRADSSATPAYAAPEQLVGGDVDARADVFSLGATLHDLLSGRLPQWRQQASAGLDSIRALVPKLDRDLAAIVDCAVDPVARWRYASGQELLEDLAAWSSGNAVSARRRSLAESAARWIAQPRNLARAGGWTIGALTGVFVGVALGSAILEVRAANDALPRGDLLAASRATDVPELFVDTFGTRDVLDFVSRLKGRQPSRASLDLDAAAQIANSLRREPRAKTVELARGLGREGGWRRRPTLSQYFAAELTTARRRANSVQVDSLLDDELFECAASISLAWPDGLEVGGSRGELVRDRRASAPVRAALREVVVNETSTYRRMCALSALAGCGIPDDIELIARRCSRLDSCENEETRVALFAVEGILLRERLAGLGKEDLAVAVPEFAEWCTVLDASDARRSRSKLAGRIRIALDMCLTEFELAGCGAELEGALARIADRGDSSQCLATQRSRLTLLATLGSFDSRWIEWTLADAARAVGSDEFPEACATIDDLVRLARRAGGDGALATIAQGLDALCQEPECSGLHASFVAAAQDGLTRLADARGRWQYTIGSAPVGAVECVDVPFERVASIPAVVALLPQTFVDDTRPTLELIAGWEFAGEVALAMGSALQLDLGASQCSMGGGHLSLTVPRGSLVRLGATTRPGTVIVNAVLAIQANMESCDYLPYQGRCDLRVVVNGVDSRVVLSITETDSNPAMASLPSILLHSGRNEIDLLGSDRTSSKCWMHRLSLLGHLQR